MYSLCCTLPLMEVGTCAGGLLLVGDGCCRLGARPWPSMLGLPGEAQGCWSCISMVGTCLSGGARGAVMASIGLLWTVAGGCPVGLSSAAWWLPGESSKAEPLGWHQKGGGRPRFTPEVPSACPSAGDSTRGKLLTSAGWGAASTVWGRSCQTSSMSWLSCALMAWFSWVMCASLDWTSLSSARSRSSVAVSLEAADSRTCSPWWYAYPRGDWPRVADILCILAPVQRCVMPHQIGWNT